MVELLFVLRPLTLEPIPDEVPKSCLFADQIDRPLVHSQATAGCADRNNWRGTSTT